MWVRGFETHFLAPYQCTPEPTQFGKFGREYEPGLNLASPGSYWVAPVPFVRDKDSMEAAIRELESRKARVIIATFVGQVQTGRAVSPNRQRLYGYGHLSALPAHLVYRSVSNLDFPKTPQAETQKR